MTTTGFNTGIDLSNSIEVVADSVSLIRENGVVNILDLIAVAGVDAYTKAETDAALLLKQDTLNWLTGDSTAKNTISTGEGFLEIAMPIDGGTFEAVAKVNGPNISGEEGQVTFYNKVVMNEALEVSGAIASAGFSVLTTDTAYTKNETSTQSEITNQLNQVFFSRCSSSRKSGQNNYNSL
jgi:hypothetical protein